MNNNFVERYLNNTYHFQDEDFVTQADIQAAAKRYKCSCCQKECYGTFVDYGFDGYEYGSISGKHVDMAFVSDCCEAELEELK